MVKYCDVVALSADGRWEEVFNCLGINQDTIVELSDLKVPPSEDISCIRNDIRTMNLLEIILALILLTDQFFLVVLLFYCALFSVTYLRLLVFTLFYKFQRSLKARILKSICGDLQLQLQLK